MLSQKALKNFGPHAALIGKVPHPGKKLAPHRFQPLEYFGIDYHDATVAVTARRFSSQNRAVRVYGQISLTVEFWIGYSHQKTS